MYKFLKLPQHLFIFFPQQREYHNTFFIDSIAIQHNADKVFSDLTFFFTCAMYVLYTINNNIFVQEP